MVAAKYLFSLLLLLLGLLLVSALITLLVGLGLLREPLPTALYAVLCCGSVALGIDAVLLPVLLKHGAEKGRFAIMAVCIAVVGGGMLLWQLHRGGSVSRRRPPGRLWRFLRSWLRPPLPCLTGSPGTSMSERSCKRMLHTHRCPKCGAGDILRIPDTPGALCLRQ